MELEGQLTFDDNPLKAKFNEGLSLIQKGKLEESLKIMEELFAINPNFTGVIEVIKVIKFWQNRWARVFNYQEGNDRAKYLLGEWDSFQIFIKNSHIDFQESIIQIKNLIFKKIIKNLITTYQQSDIPNIEILIQIGEIFISIDEYQKALESFEYAKLFRKRDSTLLSLLAEAYFKLNNIKMAKLLFREAFLFNPEKIDLNKISADFIIKIQDYLKENFNFTSEQLIQWIPVYGILLNHFNVKRELNEEDVVKITNEIQDLENQYQTKYNNTNDIILPKLINRLFWLLDYYYLQNQNDEYTKIYLEKLKNLNPDIYVMYQDLINNNINTVKVEKYEY